MVPPAVAFVSVAWVLSCCLTFSSGAPNDVSDCCSCVDLMPANRPTGIGPQIMPSPFVMHTNAKDYQPYVIVPVTVKASAAFAYRSFFIGAYVMPYRKGDLPVGQMKLASGQDVSIEEDCGQREGGEGSTLQSNAAISGDRKAKRELRFEWTPSRHYGHIEFRASFVVEDDVYWVSEKSKPLRDPESNNKFPYPRYTEPINVEQCGSRKGCFRDPPGCVEPQCMYILTWVDYPQSIEFELGGLADRSKDRYVAVGFSEDTYMGDDTVFVCAHNSESERTEIFLSYNQADPKKNILVEKYSQNGDQERYLYGRTILNQEGSYLNGRLRCRFRVKKDLGQLDENLEYLGGGPKHLLFAHGHAARGQVKRHGLSVEELPLASDGRVEFVTSEDVSGRASYPLAKAHGCLMILAWIFFASIGLLLTKYYKTMWPNSRFYEQRYWFIGHFNCMAMVFLITIIAIIIIFVEAGGYSQAPDLPQKAHPILGIIILICIIINPVLALIRPSEDSRCRPVFNWFHWAFGTIANVLAIPQIFIGMDFGKVMVPWWATWILVIWVIFHIAVELTLEIHQCCNYKKNKERRKKWEQLKKESPKQPPPEPEPAGRRFKRFMLCLHVGITTLITLIMIIIIAVS